MLSFPVNSAVPPPQRRHCAFPWCLFSVTKRGVYPNSPAPTGCPTIQFGSDTPRSQLQRPGIKGSVPQAWPHSWPPVTNGVPRPPSLLPSKLQIQGFPYLPPQAFGNSLGLTELRRALCLLLRVDSKGRSAETAEWRRCMGPGCVGSEG